MYISQHVDLVNKSNEAPKGVFIEKQLLLGHKLDRIATSMFGL
jgi:hypothetical protein